MARHHPLVNGGSLERAWKLQGEKKGEKTGSGVFTDSPYPQRLPTPFPFPCPLSVVPNNPDYVIGFRVVCRPARGLRNHLTILPFYSFTPNGQRVERMTQGIGLPC
jgi:hypothetical protein